MDKLFRFTHKLVNQTFLPKLKENGLTMEFKSKILDGFTIRYNLGMSQKEYHKYLNKDKNKISLDTIKRIETGKCYSVDKVLIYAGLD